MAENYAEFVIKGERGTDIFVRKNLSHSARAVLIIVHGLCEHGGRYDFVSDFFTRHGYHVYRHDHRGHGKSGGERGYVEDYMDYIKDTNAVVNRAKEDHPTLPLFMLGHSMGGFITAFYGLTYPDFLKGQIFSGAAVILLPLFKDLESFDYNASAYNPIANSLADLISRDAQVVRSYKEDPLVLKEFTTKLMGEVFLRGAKELMTRMKEYTYPCLILHGGGDAIVTPEASKYLFEHISSKDKEISIYEGLYHEILNEPEKMTVLNDIDHWIKQRI
ncbi:MAG: lysophospholipase [Syntrophales bacterium]|nr:lysophospholipase [Syntrophales bacterium]